MAKRKQNPPLEAAALPSQAAPAGAADPQLTTTRVDPAHHMSGLAEAPVGEPLAAELANEPVPGLGDSAQAALVLEQVRNQASQLANHLRKQQASIDHREAELNARQAALESQVRGARLWLTEQQQTLADDRAALEEDRQTVQQRDRELINALDCCRNSEQETERRVAEYKAEIDRRATELAAATHRQNSDLEHRRAELARQYAEFELADKQLAESRQALEARIAAQDQREQALDERAAQIEAASQRLADQIALGEKSEQLMQVVQKLETRRQFMDDAERLLGEQEAQVEADRRRLAEDRIALEEEVHAERRKLAEERRAVSEELDEERKKLRRRRDDLAARRIALKQLRAEVSRNQQETLEMRLATEELWARLCGTMAPAALTKSLAQLRSKLADQQRLAHQELAERQAELEALAARLAEQHAALAAEKQQLRQWAADRDKHVEEQAQHLVAREQALDQQEAEFKRQGNQWNMDRLEYDREIRRLLGQLRRVEIAA